MLCGEFVEQRFHLIEEVVESAHALIEPDPAQT